MARPTDLSTPPRLSLANLPTPIRKLDQLCQHLDNAEVWVKRDDLTGLIVSGNKIRKLEYILEAARRDGVDTVVTEGTSQSNHCRATAASCARLGMRCCLLFRPPPTEEVQGNHLLDKLFGAEIRSYARPHFDENRDAIVEEVLEDLRKAGRTPRWTPMGASEALGCWGYIGCCEELARQLPAAGIDGCDIVVAVSSGATHAGLLLGRVLYGLESCRILAVPVSDDVTFHRENTARLCRETIEQFQLPIEFSEDWLDFIDGYIGDGYAIPYDRALSSLRRLAREEAMMLDPVYTAKAFTAVLEKVEAGELGRERPVLFVHTGGVFSNFAWPQTILGGSVPTTAG